jgi:hypothetical protein
MHYDLKRYHKGPRAKARVLNYFPQYRQSDQPDDFARVKPMLHHPFHNIEKLKEIDGETHASYEHAYQNRLLNHGGLHWIDSFGNANLPDDPTESEFEPSPAEWNELAHRLPGQQGQAEDPDDLGNRTIDRSANWLDRVGQFLDLNADYWGSIESSVSG